MEHQVNKNKSTKYLEEVIDFQNKSSISAISNNQSFKSPKTRIVHFYDNNDDDSYQIPGDLQSSKENDYKDQKI